MLLGVGMARNSMWPFHDSGLSTVFGRNRARGERLTALDPGDRGHAKETALGACSLVRAEAGRAGCALPSRCVAPKRPIETLAEGIVSQKLRAVVADIVNPSGFSVDSGHSEGLANGPHRARQNDTIIFMRAGMTIDPWELSPLRFWRRDMIWKYMLVLPFKLLVAAPVLVVVSSVYILLLPYDLPVSRFLHRLTFWSWRFFLGVSLEVIDQRSNPDVRTKIAVLNHASYIDGFIVGSVVYKFRTIAASWAFDTPIYGHWLKATESIPLYRDDKSRNNAARIHEDDSDFTITLTSEGTMTNGRGLIKFRTGAFVGKADVQPIIIRYLNKDFDNCWIKTSSPLWKHLIMTISQPRNPVRVYLLEPYSPSQEEAENPILYSENVRKYMAEKTGLPLLDATYKESPALRASG